jgi:hypothetical protein
MDGVPHSPKLPDYVEHPKAAERVRKLGGVKAAAPRRYEGDMGATLHERFRDFHARATGYERLKNELELEELELLMEARAKGRLGGVARLCLSLRGEPISPAAQKRERDRLVKRLQRKAKLDRKTRAKSDQTATPCPIEMPAERGRSAEEAAMLSAMNTTSTPRYRKIVRTETVEHYTDPHDESLDGFDEDLDGDDEEFDEDTP